MKQKITVKPIQAKLDMASTIELDILKAGSRAVTPEELKEMQKGIAEAKQVEIQVEPRTLEKLIEEGIKPEDVVQAILKGEIKDVRRLD